MKNKKGFTLIELLAVIVILAIIALIAVPIVLNMINSARKSAARSAALGYIDAIEYNNGFASLGSDAEISGYTAITSGDVSEITSTLGSHLKGKAPTSGSVVIDANGKVESATDLCFNGYKVQYDGQDATVGGRCSGSSTPEPVAYKCKKATTLTSDGTHTFGTNTGSTLVPGYALDCKVTTDGDYDHRFYYVTDLEGNSNYAVLIYNNNTKVVSGTLSNDNTAAFAYDSSSENWHGPQTAIEQLPTTTQWNNISLSSTTRAIKAANYSSGNVYADATTGGDTPANFSYAGKAARLLTYKEVATACDPNNSVTNVTSTGYLDNCTYLMENTRYSNASNKSGYWLETPRSSDDFVVWGVNGNSSSRELDYESANRNSTYGVRPAIEVLKSEIDLR